MIKIEVFVTHLLYLLEDGTNTSFFLYISGWFCLILYENFKIWRKMCIISNNINNKNNNNKNTSNSYTNYLNVAAVVAA